MMVHVCKEPITTYQSSPRLDVLGAFLLLSTSVLLNTALQEADISYNWNSPLIIILLVLSAICAALFLLWERFITKHRTFQVPVLTWRFVTNRRLMGLIL